MVLRNFAPKTYSVLKETFQQGTAVASDAVNQAEKLAKAAANAAENPHLIVSGGVKTMGKIGLRTIGELDKNRLKMKQSVEELKCDEDEEPPAVFPQTSKFLSARNNVSTYIKNELE